MFAGLMLLGLLLAPGRQAQAQPPTAGRVPPATAAAASTPSANPSATPATAPSRAGTADPVDRDGSLILSHGLFDRLWVYQPTGPAQRFVLLLSGQDGVKADDRTRAQALRAGGAMVALVDVARFYPRLEAEGGQCGFANGAFENLSHHLQAYLRLPTYLTPMLVGRGVGGTLAYAMLAQAAPGTFASALSLGFCPQLPYRTPLCAANALRTQPVSASVSASATAARAAQTLQASPTASASGARAAGSTLLPGGKLSAPWTAVGSAADSACPLASAQAFVEQTPGAQWQPVAEGPAETAVARRDAAFDRAYAPLAQRSVALQMQPPPASLSDLPIIELPAARQDPTQPLAVLISGDGGWAGIDKALGAALAQRGVPVTGLDSLRYFWTARTPDSVAADLDRVIRYYLSHWGRSEVLLIGYSQGADVLPFALNRLPAATRAKVRLTTLLGPGQKAAFEFHVSHWIGPSGDRPIAPEALRLKADEVLCVYGRDERDSLCPQLAPQHARVLPLSGGHHFDGDYDQLAQRILDAMPPR